MTSEDKLRVGISACLLGERVRFDGGHKRDRFLVKSLGRFVEWIPVCPEVEFGFGIPRETLRLENREGEARIVTKSGVDHTDRFRPWSEERAAKLEPLRLDGYVLKKDSPSCGLFRVRLYDRNGVPAKNGRGVFAEALANRYPHLPIEEEGRLNDPRLRENFIERLFAHHRFRRLKESEPRPRDLIGFHAAHKLTLMAHAPVNQTALGRIVAQAGARPMTELLDDYGALFFETLRTLVSVGRHVNVLQHLAGFLKDHLDRDDKEELQAAIERYRAGIAPLLVPLTLFNHHFRRNEVPDWVHLQVYLDPYPADLALRANVV